MRTSLFSCQPLAELDNVIIEGDSLPNFLKSFFNANPNPCLSPTLKGCCRAREALSLWNQY